MAPASARDRYVTEAARLFATRGYAATSVADIQRASGVAAGSGALYKHFRSKRDLLGAVIEVHVATMRETSASFVDSLPDDLAEALTATAHAVWAAMGRDQQVLRVLLRDLDDHPDLLDRIWDGVRRDVYGEFARWLRTRQAQGQVAADDPDATAAVLLASLTYYPILDTLIARRPGDVEPDRFLQTWVAHAVTVLQPGSAG